MENVDSRFVDRLRGLSIIRVVLVHLGLSWFFLPYSSFVGIFLPVLFFCAGFLHKFLYERKSDSIVFVFERLTGIFVPFWTVYFISSGVLFWFHGNDIRFGEWLITGLLVLPTGELFPFPLGQVWFLRVLIVCILVSPVVYTLNRCRDSGYLLLFFISAIVSSGKLYGIDFISSDSPYNVHQIICYGLFYFFGAFTYSKSLTVIGYWSRYIIPFLALIGFCLFNIFDLKADYSAYSYEPNLYHMILGFIGIFLCLFFRAFLEWLFAKNKIFDSIVMFFNKHSFSVYLLHSLIIYSVERIGLVNVAESPVMLLVKIVVVILCSALLSLVVTPMSKNIMSVVRGVVLSCYSRKWSRSAE